MLFKFNMTEKDYESAFKSYSQKHEVAMNVFSIMSLISASIFLVISILVFLIMSVIEPSPKAHLIVIFAPLTLFVLAVLTSPKFRIRRMLNRQIKMGALPNGYFGSQTLEVKEDRILIHYGESKAERFYAGIDKIENYYSSILIFVSAASFDIIPSSAFQNMEERLNLIDLLKVRMAAAKDLRAGSGDLEEEREGSLITFDFSWDEPSYIQALIAGNRVFTKTKLFWTPGRIMTLILGLMFAVPAFSHNDNAVSRLIMLFIGVSLLFLVLSVYTPLMNRAVKKQVRSGRIQRDAIGSHIVCVFKNKLKLFSRLSSQDMSFDQLYAVKRFGDYIVILGKANIILVFPTAAFKSSESFDDFMEFLSGKIKVL